MHHMIAGGRMARPACLAVLGALLLLAGCGQTVRVNSYLNPADQGKLLPGATVSVLTNPKAANPLLDQEVARKLEALLANAAYRPGGQSTAELLFTFHYKAQSRTVTETRSIYQPGEDVQVQSKNSKGETVTTTVQQPGRTIYVPETVTRQYNTLSVQAHVNSGGRPGQVIWQVDAGLTSEYEDLRITLNYLIVAAVDALGHNTGRTVEVTIKDDDPRLKLISGM